MRSLLLLAGALPALGKGLFGSPNGKCGEEAGFTCTGSFYGGCCSADGKCGSDAASCGAGCQSDYGWCSSSKRDTATCPAPKQAFSCPDADGTVFTLMNSKSYQIECGTSYTGTDLPGSGEACADLDTCIAKCADTDSCAYAAFASGTCTLKSSTGTGTSSEGAACAHLIQGSGASALSSLGYGPAPTPSSGSSSSGSGSGSGSSGSGSGSSGSGSGSSGSGSGSSGSGSGSSGSGSGSSGSGSGSSGSDSGSSGSGSGSSGSGSGSSGSGSGSSGSGSDGSGSGSGSWIGTSTDGAAASSKTPDGYYGSIPWYSPVVSSKGSEGGHGSSGSRTVTGSASWSKATPFPSMSGGYNSTRSWSTGTNSATSSSSLSSSSTSSTCSTVPTLSAGTIPGCKRCDGQPGTDKYCGFDINTNYYQDTPKTCNVVTYNFDITETTTSPDGVERFAMLVNGQFPGPAVKASWGDTIVVTVNNQMTSNGTSIHFHGMRQMNNNGMDGVPSITQCPIAPGDSLTYTFVAEHYGTSWYHSHFAMQAWEGVHGPVIIDGPSSASYDEDLGAFIVEDWSHFTVDSRYDLAENATEIPGGNGATYGGPVTMDTGLINGKNVWNGDGGNSTPIGARLELPSFQAGKSYRLRFINAAIQSTYKLYLDSHEFEVIANDFVPITPYTTKILNINIGQRYDVIVKASQSTGNYWLRADNQNACANTVQALDIKAVVRYEGSSNQLPTSTAYTYDTECVDEPMANLVPVLPLNAGPADVTEGTFDVLIAGNDAQLYKWYLSGTTFKSSYSDPTLVHIAQNGSTPDYSGDLLINVPKNGTMVYVVIESVIPLPHPIHLHGHDFFVLGQGSGSYSSSSVLQTSNPPRRDTALMPGAGWLVVGFVTDNPGVWLMHCHIGWHTSMGFALQFVEMQDSIKTSGALKNSCALEDTCTKWNAWAVANDKTVMEDSGV